MKKSLQWGLGFLVVMVALAFVLPAGASSTSQSKTPAKKTEKKKVYWEISATDASANTIELQLSDTSSNLTLKVTAATKITVDNKPGKLADLQKGQKVKYTQSGGNCSTIEAVATSDSKKKK